MSFRDHYLENQHIYLKLKKEDDISYNKLADKKKEECLRELDQLLELQKDMHTMLLTQDESIESICNNVDKASVEVSDGKQEIKKAHKIYWKYAGPLSAGIVGSVISGPVGFFAVGLKGLSLAGATLGGGLLAGITSKTYNLKKNKEINKEINKSK